MRKNRKIFLFFERRTGFIAVREGPLPLELRLLSVKGTYTEIPLLPLLPLQGFEGIAFEFPKKEEEARAPLSPFEKSFRFSPSFQPVEASFDENTSSLIPPSPGEEVSSSKDGEGIHDALRQEIERMSHQLGEKFSEASEKNLETLHKTLQQVPKELNQVRKIKTWRAYWMCRAFSLGSLAAGISSGWFFPRTIEREFFVSQDIMNAYHLGCKLQDNWNKLPQAEQEKFKRMLKK